jgi:hypothetical protein
MTQSGHRSHSKAPPLLVSNMLMWRIGQAAPLRGCMSIQQMQRRAFIAGLGGAAAWPLLVDTQSAACKPTVVHKIAIKSEIKGVTLAIKKERLP